MRCGEIGESGEGGGAAEDEVEDREWWETEEDVEVGSLEGGDVVAGGYDVVCAVVDTWVQTDVELYVVVQVYSGSLLQEEHPLPAASLPTSHSSLALRTPSPHTTDQHSEVANWPVLHSTLLCTGTQVRLQPIASSSSGSASMLPTPMSQISPACRMPSPHSGNSSDDCSGVYW